MTKSLTNNSYRSHDNSVLPIIEKPQHTHQLDEYVVEDATASMDSPDDELLFDDQTNSSLLLFNNQDWAISKIDENSRISYESDHNMKLVDKVPAGLLVSHDNDDTTLKDELLMSNNNKKSLLVNKKKKKKSDYNNIHWTDNSILDDSTTDRKSYTTESLKSQKTTTTTSFLKRRQPSSIVGLTPAEKRKLFVQQLYKISREHVDGVAEPNVLLRKSKVRFDLNATEFDEAAAPAATEAADETTCMMLLARQTNIFEEPEYTKDYDDDQYQSCNNIFIRESFQSVALWLENSHQLIAENLHDAFRIPKNLLLDCSDNSDTYSYGETTDYYYGDNPTETLTRGADSVFTGLDTFDENMTYESLLEDTIDGGDTIDKLAKSSSNRNERKNEERKQQQQQQQHHQHMKLESSTFTSFRETMEQAKIAAIQLVEKMRPLDTKTFDDNDTMTDAKDFLSISTFDNSYIRRTEDPSK